MKALKVLWLLGRIYLFLFDGNFHAAGKAWYFLRMYLHYPESTIEETEWSAENRLIMLCGLVVTAAIILMPVIMFITY